MDDDNIRAGGANNLPNGRIKHGVAGSETGCLGNFSRTGRLLRDNIGYFERVRLGPTVFDNFGNEAGLQLRMGR